MRDIKPEEKALLTAMVNLAGTLDAGSATPSPEQRQQVLENLAGAQVAQECGCGTCPSIVLTTPLPTTGITSLLSAGVADGASLVLLHLRQGAVAELEIAPLREGARVALPAPGNLVF